MSVSAPAVLVVEDDPDDVFLIRRAFEKAGISNPLHVVVDGEHAIAYLSGRGEFADREKYPTPALILLDLKLPKVPGLAVLSWLRKQPALGRLLVVVLTSSRETVDINRAYDLGANSYLVKPVSLADLTAMMKSVEHYWLSLNEGPHLDR